MKLDEAFIKMRKGIACRNIKYPEFTYFIRNFVDHGELLVCCREGQCEVVHELEVNDFFECDFEVCVAEFDEKWLIIESY